MTVKVRIDYVRPRRGGDAYGLSSNAIQEVVIASETVVVGEASVLSTAAPVFAPDDRGTPGGVFARITCIDGAVIVTEAAAAPVATETSGLRIETAGGPVLMPIETGYRFAFILAADQPAAGGGGGGGGDANAANQLLTNLAIGAPASPSAGDDTGEHSLISLAKRGLEKSTSIAGGIVNILAALPASLGQKLKAGSLSVALASDDNLVAATGSKDDASATSDTGSFSRMSFVKRGQEKLTSIAGALVNILTSLGSVSSTAGDGSLAGRLASILGALSDTTPVSTYAVSLRLSASFNRPADTTPYVVGDLIANATAMGSVAPLALAVAAGPGGKGIIRGVKLDMSGATSPGALRAHFFSAAPAMAGGDNAPFAASVPRAGYLGFIDVTVFQAFTNGFAGTGIGEVPFDLGAGITSVAALVEARAAFAPVSGATIAAEVTSWPEAAV